MKKQKKPLVLEPRRLEELKKQDLDKVAGGNQPSIPKQPDPGSSS